MSELPWLDYAAPNFPETDCALEYPDGLLAAGGNLSPTVLLDAYSRGIFPWFSDGEPILWWTPKLRAVLLPRQLKISRGSRKQLRKVPYALTTDTAFEAVIQGCAEQRQESGTWITPDVISAYTKLHKLGIAHSVEVWEGEALVGGLYGLKLGKMFCGESMFNSKDSAAKFAFCALAERLFDAGYHLIDCQIQNEFLASLGVGLLPREEFENLLGVAQTEDIDWPEDWSSVNWMGPSA